MKKEVEYEKILTNEDKVKIYFKKQRGKIIKFIVQYLIFMNDKWRTVVRIDTCHGYPHMHTYYLQRRQLVVKLGSIEGNNRLFTQYKEYVIKNFLKIRENFIFSK